MILCARPLATFVLGLCLGAGLAAPASAWQSTSVAKLPKPFEPGPVTAWLAECSLEKDPRAPEVFLRAQPRSVEDGFLEDIVHAVANDFGAKPWPVHVEEHKRVLARVTRLADDLRVALATSAPDGLLDSQEEIQKLLAALNGQGHAVQEFEPSLVGPEGNTFLVFFDRDGHPEERVITYRNASTDTEEKYELLLTPEEMIDLRLRGAVLTRVLTKCFEGVRQKNVAALDRAVERWSNYLDRGYSQYPWESLFNGYVLDIPELGPPNEQFILLHPALGVEVSTRSFDDLQASEALNLEVFGYLRYRGKKLDNFSGGSLAVTLRDDLGPGLGVIAHISRNFNVGLSWHDVDDDGRYFDDSPHVFFSLDLYRFVAEHGSKFGLARARDVARVRSGSGE